MRKLVRFSVLWLLVATVAAGCGGSGPTGPGPGPDTYSVSGVVLDGDGEGMAGVELGFSPGSLTAQTGSDGSWSRSGLEDGQSYTVTPSFAGWSFTPASVHVSGEQSGIEFSGEPLSMGSLGPMVFDDGHELWLWRPDGLVENITPQIPGIDVERGIHPAWSPDGSGIAFRHRATHDIYIMDPAGDGVPVFLVENAWFPTWSHDSERIAYLALVPTSPSTYEVRSRPVVGGDETVLVAAGEPRINSRPVFSPTDDRLAYHVPQGVRVLLEDGSTLELTDQNGDRFPAWSPDGSRIAFVRGNYGTGANAFRIMVVNADGSGEPTLVNGFPMSFGDPYIAWSADGQVIAAASGAFGRVIQAFHVATGTDLGVVVGPMESNNTLGSFSFAPVGW